LTGFVGVARRLHEVLYGETATPAALSADVLLVWFDVEADEVRAALRRYRSSGVDRQVA
jgi:hypothetical protein